VSGPAADANLRALVIAAHADDDAVGFGIGLRDRRAAAIAYLTDSAPRDPRFFTTPSPSRQLYAAARRAETLRAAAMLGVAPQSLFFFDAVDMEAFRELARLDRELSTLATGLAPQIIWSPAYDGIPTTTSRRSSPHVSPPGWRFRIASSPSIQPVGDSSRCDSAARIRGACGSSPPRSRISNAPCLPCTRRSIRCWRASIAPASGTAWRFATTSGAAQSRDLPYTRPGGGRSLPTCC